MSKSDTPPDPEEWSDEQVDALLERLEERVDTNSELGQAIVSRRRDVLKAIGAVGTGGALGAVGMDAVSRDAAAADSSVGQIGSAGSSVDVVLDELKDDGGDLVADLDDTGDINWQGRGFDNLASIETGRVADLSDNTMLDTVAATGQVTLSSGTAVVDTGISATDATFTLALGIDDPNADAKVTGRLFWDDSAGSYKIEIVEDGTSVGNPSVNYDVVRVR